MIERVSKYILNKICDKNETKEKKEILLFGITRIIEDIPKAIGITIVGIIFGLIKEMAIVTAVIILYKTFVGGVHSKTNINCFVCSLFFYLICIYSAKYISIPNNQYIYLLVFIFSIYTIITYAPADVPEIPKVNMKLRKTLKIKAMTSLVVIYIIAIFLIRNIGITNLIIHTIFYIDIMATRTLYKLFNNEYGYETYVPDELI